MVDIVVVGVVVDVVVVVGNALYGGAAVFTTLTCAGVVNAANVADVVMCGGDGMHSFCSASKKHCGMWCTAK